MGYRKPEVKEQIWLKQRDLRERLLYLRDDYGIRMNIIYYSTGVSRVVMSDFLTGKRPFSENTERLVREYIKRYDVLK